MNHLSNDNHKEVYPGARVQPIGKVQIDGVEIGGDLFLDLHQHCANRLRALGITGSALDMGITELIRLAIDDPATRHHLRTIDRLQHGNAALEHRIATLKGMRVVPHE